VSPDPGLGDPAEANQRRAARNAAVLGALVRRRWDVDPPRTPLGTGAAASHDHRAFVLLDVDHGLGAALAWARRAGATEVHVVGAPDAGIDAGAVARQAGEFGTDVSVWSIAGQELRSAEATAVEAGAGPPDAPALVALLEEHGLDVVVEGDRLAGEFRGLEVARIVRARDDGEPILEVGVGRFDRELTATMHGELPDATSVGRVVDQLRRIRHPQGPAHPLASLVPERWLRRTLVDDPTLIGCEDLVAAPTPVPRDRLRERGVAAALGTRSGERVVVACTVGVDFEAVVLAADARLAIDPSATLLLALPERDVLPVNAALVADLVRPAELAPVAGDWRR
jgi:hypothetical protein